MKTLLKILKWEMILQLRYNIVTVALILALLYIIVLRSLTNMDITQLLIVLVLSDPVMFGVMFVGVLVLYEKDNNTLNALLVSPMKPSHYLLSKAISLTLIATPVALAIAVFGFGIQLNYLYFLISVVLTSVIFVFLGFAVVSNVKGFNQYVIKFALFTLPVSIPVLELFNIAHSKLFYLIPTQATILLLKSGFKLQLETWQVVYSITYLIVWIIISYFVARKAFKHNLLNGKTNE